MSLHTTNILLGILAATSLLEAVVVLVLGIGGFLVIRRLLRLVDDLERRHLGPAAASAGAILENVREVTAEARDQSRRVGSWIERLFGD